jgi:hypothetical protein
MKVIAIKEAPNIDTTISWAKKFNIDRAYQKADIFETKNENFQNDPVIFNYHINDFMHVNPENFQSLEDYREKQLDSIIQIL